VRVRVSRRDPDLPLPAPASPGAAGLDLICREDVSIEPGGLGFVAANVIVAVPADHVLLIALRSSTPRRTGLIAPHGIGVIDPDYCGPEDEILIQVYNPGKTAVTVRRGDRIAQAILVPRVPIEWQEEPLPATVSRGGFGSTG
jgi:dUTP pyrophosphatase